MSTATNVLTISRIIKANKLSDVMVGAILTGENGQEIQAGPKQIVALVERDLVESGPHPVLTDRGELVLKALKGEFLTEGEEAQVFPVAATGGQRYAVVTEEAGADPIIVLHSEAPDTAPLSFHEARAQLIEHFAERRDHYKILIKNTRSLRVSDLSEDAETDEDSPEE